MTLLIYTISKRHIVITSDGLSRVNPITCAGIGFDTFQKVFPIPDMSIVRRRGTTLRFFFLVIERKCYGFMTYSNERTISD